jgi:hypothetical protein
MPNGSFSPSVCVKTGEGTQREVASIRDVDEILLDWPQARRGDFYRRVRECVEVAKRGEASPAELRELFVAFAQHARVLVARPAGG